MKTGIPSEFNASDINARFLNKTNLNVDIRLFDNQTYEETKSNENIIFSYKQNWDMLVGNKESKIEHKVNKIENKIEKIKGKIEANKSLNKNNKKIAKKDNKIKILKGKLQNFILEKERYYSVLIEQQEELIKAKEIRNDQKLQMTKHFQSECFENAEYKNEGGHFSNITTYTYTRSYFQKNNIKYQTIKTLLIDEIIKVDSEHIKVDKPSSWNIKWKNLRTLEVVIFDGYVQFSLNNPNIPSGTYRMGFVPNIDKNTLFMKVNKDTSLILINKIRFESGI